MANYIANKIKYNEINDINISDFQQYLIEIDNYNKINDNNPNSEKNNIVKLALKSINTNGDYEKFKNYTKIREEQSNKVINCTTVLKDAVNIVAKKYGCDVAIRHLKRYIETGDITVFSRDNNSREKVNLFLNVESKKNIIDEMIPGEEQEKRFVEMLLDKDLEKEKMEILERASLMTFKYNESNPGQLKAALSQLVDNNDCSYFTNGNGFREKLKINIKAEEATELIKKQLIMDHIVKINENINNPVALYVMNIEKKAKTELNRGQLR